MNGMKTRRVAFALLLCGSAVSCFRQLPSRGGGEVKVPSPLAPGAPPERKIDPGDIAVPGGYRIEAVARGFTYPTAVAFDGDGRTYVLESGYSYGEVFLESKLLRLEADGRTTLIASGKNPPWNGMVFHEGAFFIAEGGVQEGGRILRITPDGKRTALVEGLPSFGDHHTNGPVVHEGFVYFGQGTATNSGVVGPDNAKFGWLKRRPGFHDVPCKDVTLAGANFETGNALSGDEKDRKVTGAYLPFGTPSRKGQVIEGSLPCSGAVMRVPVGGGPVELVAWGFRNPFGLAFSPDRRLFVAENGFDMRGSRPVWGAADLLWEVEEGGWYGWPDHADGRHVDQKRYKVLENPMPPRLLAEHPGKPPKPVAWFPVHSSTNGLDFSRNEKFGHAGEAFLAQFGDMTPETGKVASPVGFKVVRVDMKTGASHDFASNRGRENGPASKTKGGGLERPVGVRFDPAGTALYVVDFGIMALDEKGPKAQMETGVLWRITRSAEEPDPKRVQQEPRTESQLRGRAVFDEWCTQCHPHGEAGLGPPFNEINLPPKAIEARVRNHLGPTMPIFGSDEISDPELKDLINYMQALRRK